MEMDDNTLVAEIKKSLGITTDDPLVLANIKTKAIAAKNYLVKGGALHMKADSVTIKYKLSEEDITCIAIGTNDLLNNKPGETKFSPAFILLAQQICRG